MGKEKTIAPKSRKICFLVIIVILLGFPIFGDIGLAGAELPYNNDWYRNPALQNTDKPELVFTSSTTIPSGLLNLLHPDNLPYEMLQDGIDSSLDIDLLSLYVQMSNPLLLILNPPKSPDEVTINISQQKIQILDESGNQIPLESIPGQGSFSVSHTPLFPPPLFYLSTSRENIYFGLGLFGGSSGISFIYDDNFNAMLSDTEIIPGDSTSIHAEFSARSGIFEYVNIISEPVDLFDELELQLAGRLLIYQILAEVNASAALDISIVENYVLSDVESNLDFFYYYPGKGYGLGARLDLGAVLRFSELTVGLSVLNLQGIEYSTGLKLQDDIYLTVENIYYSFRPYFLLQGSYYFRINDEFAIIPVLDIGYGKTLFTHGAMALFWNDISLKMGIAYEDRIKGAMGAGLRLGCFSIETGVVIQQTVFDNMLTGIFFSMGLSQ